MGAQAITRGPVVEESGHAAPDGGAPIAGGNGSGRGLRNYGLKRFYNHRPETFEEALTTAIAELIQRWHCLPAYIVVCPSQYQMAVQAMPDINRAMRRKFAALMHDDVRVEQTGGCLLWEVGVDEIPAHHGNGGGQVTKPRESNGRV
jgi:hypothetical protein